MVANVNQKSVPRGLSATAEFRGELYKVEFDESVIKLEGLDFLQYSTLI